MVVQFGAFYVVNAESALEASNCKISISELEAAVTHNRLSRKVPKIRFLRLEILNLIICMP
jgi:hypothetical protein